MPDRDFLIWLHERLVKVHGENESYDYMHKLRCIISDTPPDKETPNYGSFDSLEDMKAQLSHS